MIQQPPRVIAHIFVGLVRPVPFPGDCLYAVSYRAPRLFGRLKPVAFRQLLLCVSEESLANLLVSYGRGHEVLQGRCVAAISEPSLAGHLRVDVVQNLYQRLRVGYGEPTVEFIRRIVKEIDVVEVYRSKSCSVFVGVARAVYQPPNVESQVVVALVRPAPFPRD